MGPASPWFVTSAEAAKGVTRRTQPPLAYAGPQAELASDPSSVGFGVSEVRVHVIPTHICMPAPPRLHHLRRRYHHHHNNYLRHRNYHVSVRRTTHK
jgi:hypothetical protein